MSVRRAVDTTSRAFATGGDDFAYYLSESRAMQGLTAPAHRGQAPNDKGSGQSITVQLATAILRNIGVHLKYIDSVRADGSDMNRLLVAAWDGLEAAPPLAIGLSEGNEGG